MPASPSRTRLAAFVSIAVALAACAQDRFTGKCTSVRDGDTIEVMRDGRAVRVRLWGVDCPEQGQPFSARAREFTADLAFGKQVGVEVVEVDRYGRIVGRVTVGDHDLSLALVQEGLAWWYEFHAPHASDLAAAQEEARKARRNLWSDPHAVPPREWRSKHPRTPR